MSSGFRAIEDVECAIRKATVTLSDSVDHLLQGKKVEARDLVDQTRDRLASVLSMLDVLSATMKEEEKL